MRWVFIEFLKNSKLKDRLFNQALILFTARYGDQTSVRLILKDVNDNAPQMPSSSVRYEMDENAEEVKYLLKFDKKRFDKLNIHRI